MKAPPLPRLTITIQEPFDRNTPLRTYLREQGVADLVASHPTTLRLTGDDQGNPKPRRKLKPTAKARKAKAMKGQIRISTEYGNW